MGINDVKVSIIICAYNTEKYIRECLDSVLNQSFGEYEVICVDDGSTDTTKDIISEYCLKDARFTLICNDKNSGPSISRNKAIKIAKGDYLVFLDSDDYLIDSSLEILYKKATNLNFDMLSFGAQSFYDETRELANSDYYSFLYLPENFNKEVFNYKDCIPFINSMAVSCCLTMYKSEFVKKHTIEFPEHLFYEDNFFFTKAILNADRVGVEKTKLYQRRLRKNSTIHSTGSNFLDFLHIVYLVLTYVKQKDESLYEQYRLCYLNEIEHNFSKFPFRVKLKYIPDMYTFCRHYRYKFPKKGIHRKGYFLLSLVKRRYLNLFDRKSLFAYLKEKIERL